MNRFDFTRRNGAKFSIWLEIDEAKLAEHIATKYANSGKKRTVMKIGNGSVVAHIKED